MRGTLLILVMNLLVMVMGSCGGDNAVAAASAPGVLVVSCPSPTPFALCTAKDPSSTALEPDGVYSATVGGVETVAEITGGEVHFLIPPVAAGRHELRVDAGGSTISASVDVGEAPPIADPAAIVNATLGAAEIGLGEKPGQVDAAIAAGLLSAEAKTDLDKLSAKVADAKTKTSALSPDDQRTLAAFLVANKPLFDELAAATAELEMIYASKSKFTDEVHRRCAPFPPKVATAIAVTTLAGLIVKDAAPALVKLASTPWGFAVVVTGAVVVSAVIGEQIYSAMQAAEQCLHPFVVLAKVLVQEFKADEQFSAGMGKPVGVDVSYRTLAASDTAHPVAWVAAIPTAAEKLRAFWTKFFSAASFPQYLAKEETRALDRLEDVQLVVSGNAKVTGSLTGTPEAPELRFHTTETTPQSFSYVLKIVDNEMVTERAAVTAVVSPANCERQTIAGEPRTEIRQCKDTSDVVIEREQCIFTAGTCTSVGWTRLNANNDRFTVERIDASPGYPILAGPLYMASKGRGNPSNVYWLATEVRAYYDATNNGLLRLERFLKKDEGAGCKERRDLLSIGTAEKCGWDYTTPEFSFQCTSPNRFCNSSWTGFSLATSDFVAVNDMSIEKMALAQSGQACAPCTSLPYPK